MDVVPYVTSIWTELSEYDRNNPSVYARSSIGKYPVRVGENITVYAKWEANVINVSFDNNGESVVGEINGVTYNTDSSSHKLPICLIGSYSTMILSFG